MRLDAAGNVKTEPTEPAWAIAEQMVNPPEKVLVRKPGSFDRLEFVPMEIPKAKPGQVVVATVAAGVNYADVCVRWGVYESAKKYVGWPITPGFEFSGRVLSLGEGVTGFAVGDEVFGVTRFSAYASYIAADADLLWKRPAELSLAQAAAFPAVFLTAYHGLLQSVYIRRGMKVLIHSAAGGVGSALVQLCNIHGMDVTGVVGSSHKVDFVRGLGAKHVIDKSSGDLWEECERAEPGGYHLVFDANGPETLQGSYDHLAPTGKLVCYGFHTMLPKESGRIDYWKALIGICRMPRFNPLNMTNANKSVIAFNLSFLFDRKELLAEAMPELLGWLADGRLRPPRVEEFFYRDVGLAHRAIQSGRTQGKLVLMF